ncbi:MAG TPA: hypothetical protein DEO89_03050 [Lachnospiraceae bacterium]|nr:hypothetical protein [Lachnospiraceae bacterium]
MKKVNAVIACLLVVIMLTGCAGVEMNMQVNEDGTCRFAVTYCYQQSLYENMKQEKPADFEQGSKEINGKTYLTFRRELTFSSIEEMKNALENNTAYINALKNGSQAPEQYKEDQYSAPFENVTLTKDTFIGKLRQTNLSSTTQTKQTGNGVTDISSMVNGASGNISMAEYYKMYGVVMDISISLPQPIRESNGQIEGNQAKWTVDNMPADEKLIAVSSDQSIFAGDKEAPVIRGVKNNTATRNPVVVHISDNVCVKDVQINGKSYFVSDFQINKQGKFQIKAIDTNGNSSMVKFTIDRWGPNIYGVKNKKVYRKKVKLSFFDNCGIKYIKVNGKKQKARKKLVIRKKGKNTVIACDKAGNQSKVVFTIK